MQETDSNVYCLLGVGRATIRIFGSVTQFLGKVGASVFIEVDQKSCTLRSVSDSSQCFGCCRFDRTFFSKFEAPPATIRCKVPVRTFIAAFRNLRTVQGMEILFFRGKVESLMMFRLTSPMGILKKYKFFIEDCEILDAVFDEAVASNKISCGSQKLASIFGHMHGSNEVAITLSLASVRL